VTSREVLLVIDTSLIWSLLETRATSITADEIRCLLVTTASRICLVVLATKNVVATTSRSGNRLS